MKLKKTLMTKNPCYKAGKTIKVKGLMLHSTGCPQPGASVYISSWNSPEHKTSCVHGFIDGNDGTVYQTLPWNYRGWHCGSSKKGSANNTHIGVEMCEPSCITYVGGGNFKCSDNVTARAVVKRTYESAVELFARLCKEFHLDPLADGVIISHKEGHGRGIASNHGDPEHLWSQLGTKYTMNTFRKAVKDKLSSYKQGDSQIILGTQAVIFKTMTEEQAVAEIGELCKADSRKSGILASISAAQFILECGYGKSELAQNANNCFGMKKSLSGNTWSGSAWDGKSVYTKKTKEEYTPGVLTEITADFRKYPKVEDSIADHSAYLLGAMNGSKKRYEGLSGCTDYKKAAQLIKDGGYATSSTYVEKLCSIIERWNLTQYDVKAERKDSYYRVRKSWQDAKSQLGAYKVLANAKKCADKNPGYTVYDPNGKAVYPVAQNEVAVPFCAKVSIDDLNIRRGPGTNYGTAGVFTGKGVFTIVEVADGPGASKWGLLKSYADKRNGWISLDYANRL